MTVKDLSSEGLDTLSHVVKRMTYYKSLDNEQLCATVLKRYPDISMEPIIMEMMNRIDPKWNEREQ